MLTNKEIIKNWKEKNKELYDRSKSFLRDNNLDIDRDIERLLVLPSLCDVHVHFREPGYSYKETIKTGTMAAAAGGYTSVCTMPNLNPVPDTLENLKIQLDIIKKDAIIDVFPLGSITKKEHGKELSDMEDMSKYVCGFTDDGVGVQSEEMMRLAMSKAKALGKIIVAHCEDNSLLDGGYIHDGKYAREHGHRGICSESEYVQVARDIRLAMEHDCDYHICHISAKESVCHVMEAKKSGVKVTCETTPHYLIFADEDLQEDGKWKMNPPIRSAEDRDALIEGINNGTIDIIATDHAPHSIEEKSKGLVKSAMGIVGLETSFRVLYTKLVKESKISLERLIECMSTSPRQRFKLPSFGDFTIWDMEECDAIDPNSFFSKGRATPFEGMKVYGKNLLTVHREKIVYKNFQ